MIEIHVPKKELWDKSKNEFLYTKEVTLRLEHSLVSLTKWESKWHIPYLESENKTREQILDYVRCMTMNQDVDPNTYYNLTNEQIATIDKYINDPMTATTFRDDQSGPKSSEGVTNEVIYYWMFSNGIPKECEKWHLNRLLTLIKVFGVKNQKQKKKPQRQVQDEYRAINAKRRAEQAAKSGGKR